MKKKLLTAALLTVTALTLVVASVLGTIAYLTASSAVSNTFTVGNVAIDMWETKVDEDGTPVNPAATTKANVYKLVPGEKYMKDPTIEVKSTLNGEKMYLFVKSQNGIRNIEEGNHAAPVSDALPSMRQQMEKNGWVQLLTSGDGKQIVWVYGTRNDQGVITPVAVDATYQQDRFVMAKQEGAAPTFSTEKGPAGQIQLCQFFKIDSRYSDLSEHNSSMVDFTAFAIQISGIDSAADGWEAVKAAHENATAIVNPKNPYDDDADPYEEIPKVNP